MSVRFQSYLLTVIVVLGSFAPAARALSMVSGDAGWVPGLATYFRIYKIENGRTPSNWEELGKFLGEPVKPFFKEHYAFVQGKVMSLSDPPYRILVVGRSPYRVKHFRTNFLGGYSSWLSPNKGRFVISEGANAEIGSSYLSEEKIQQLFASAKVALPTPDSREREQNIQYAMEIVVAWLYLLVPGAIVLFLFTRKARKGILPNERHA